MQRYNKIYFKKIVEPIVISKLFLDNEIITLIKISYVTCKNIYYFISLKIFQSLKHVLKKIDMQNQIINHMTKSYT